MLAQVLHCLPPPTTCTATSGSRRLSSVLGERALRLLSPRRRATTIVSMPDTLAAKPAFDSWIWRVGNALVSVPARLGIGPIHLLMTRGRRTGDAHTTPVVPVECNGRKWLVAPYGPVSWVHNVRNGGLVRMRYGRATRDYTVRELGAEEAGPVLKRYVSVATKTRAHFRATEDSPVEDFVAEADRHPVFELVPLLANALSADLDE